MAKILVVDDDPMTLELLVDTLEVLGFETTTATNGEGAVTAAIAYQPDAILLDVMMPGLDGFEVTRRLRAAPETTHCKVVLLTALSSAEGEAQAMAAGADGFLQKPFTIRCLKSVVKNLLP